MVVVIMEDLSNREFPFPFPSPPHLGKETPLMHFPTLETTQSKKEPIYYISIGTKHPKKRALVNNIRVGMHRPLLDVGLKN